MKTVVVATCVKKTQSQSYTVGNPINHTIDLQLPYNPKDIYYQMSGGSNFQLCTINQGAADMYTVGHQYKIEISEVIV